MNDQKLTPSNGQNSNQPPPLPSHFVSKNLEPKTEQIVPEGVKGWCWGGLLLSWIWAIRFRVWWGLLALIPVLGLVVVFWLGLRGRELAWRRYPWESLDQFNRAQRLWSNWGFCVALIGTILAVGGHFYSNRVANSSPDEGQNSPQKSEYGSVDVQPTPAEDKVKISETGHIDSNDPDLPLRIEVVSGILEKRMLQEGNTGIYFNGEAIFHGSDAPYQQLIKNFHFSDGSDAVLLASSGGRGNSCETLFFFLLIDSTGIRYTPEFGSCSSNAIFEQKGDIVVLTIPRMGGISTAVLDQGVVTEDGKALTLVGIGVEDPSK